MADRYDVNNDGKVNVTDAMLVVDRVLGKPIPNKDINVKDALLRIASSLRDISNTIEDFINAQNDAPIEPQNPEEPQEPSYIEKIEYDPSARFDRHVGNPGVFRINKNPEDITVGDVTDACELPSLYEGISDRELPVGLGKDSATPHIWTAEEIGLTEGDNDTAAKSNVTKIREAVASDNCIGIKLDKLYSLRLTNLTSNISIPSHVKETNIVLPRNFIIDGDVDGSAVGGFIVRNGYGNVFYTEHSLVLRKIQMLTYRVSSSASFFINTVSGIEKLEADGCVFDGYGNYKDKCNYNICVYSDGSADCCPHDGNWVPSPYYYINHIYLHDCVCRGSHFLYSTGNFATVTSTNEDGTTKKSGVYVPCARVVKSFRIISNEVSNIKANGINWSTGNDGKVYGDMMAYMSCPMYVVGNTFKGQDRLHRTNGWYYDGVIVENSEMYVLHNKFANFISGADVKSDGTWGGGIATYDLYFNGQRIYYANNEVTDVVKLRVGSTGASGIIKAKGCNINSRIFDDPSVKNASLHRNVVRYYKRNRFILNPEHVRQVWNERTPLTDPVGIEEEDKITASLDDVILIRLDTYTSAAIPVDEFTFSENLVDAGDGCICGSVNSAQWYATRFKIEDNVFKAARMSSYEWGNNADSGKIISYTWLFPIKLSQYYGEPCLHLKNNKFYLTSNLTVQFVLSRYAETEYVEGAVPKPTDYIFEGNEITKGSTLTTKTLKTTGFNHYSWENVDGTL